VVVDKVIVLLVIKKVQMADRAVVVIIDPKLQILQGRGMVIQVPPLHSIHPQVLKVIPQERALTVEDKPAVAVAPEG
jgi:hypothetical protein